ncbi:MAG: hypothetical protein JXR19_03140 [Bacteroidia bacterium]
MTSCDNELEVAAEWKEIPIIYGALNPTSNVNYIRIQRAYLDKNTGALSFSGIPDSLYFDTLVVSITEILNGVEKNTYSLVRVDGNEIGVPKDSGIFSNEYNYLYRLNAELKASSFFNTYEYKLTVFNPLTGHISKSSCLSVGQAEVESPASKNTTRLIISADSNSKVVGLFQEGIYARSYDMILRMRVEEISNVDTTDSRILELDWIMLSGRRTKSLDGFNQSVNIIPSANFFSFVSSQLDSTLNVKRRLLNFDLLTYGIGDDLHTYISVNEPSIGIVQKKPEFTNIENGFGIFSSRHINKLSMKGFDRKTREALQISEKTSNLGFVLY